MNELDENTDQSKPAANLTGARLRKQRRERRPGSSSTAETGSSKHRPGNQRATRRRGPSLREQLAATHISVPTPSFDSIHDKVSSTIGHLSSQFSGDGSSRKSSSSDDTSGSARLHHLSSAARSESFPGAIARSDTKRRRATDQSFHPQKNKRVYDARAEASPPVMVRGGMGGMAFGRSGARTQNRKSPRRRIDLPLNIPGAEVRLPSIPIMHLGWRAISLIMVLMMTVSLFAIWKAPMFQVNTIQAKGLKRLTVTDLNAVLGTFGRSVFSLNPSILKDNLQQAFPELSKISVRVNLPASVKVVVQERIPVIAWIQDGSETWLDAEGVSFPPRGNPDTPLVRVEGHGTPPNMVSGAPAQSQNLPPGYPTSMASNIPTLRLSPDLVASILALGAKMPADTLLVYDSEHGLGWNDPNGWEVYFGAEDQDMQMKLNVYQALVERLQSEGIQPALISVEYVYAPYYRMER